MAETYLKLEDWSATKTKILADNTLQARSASSGRRMELELRNRLMLLTHPQIQLAAHGMTDERIAIAWLAAMKGSQFIFAFAANALRSKISQLDPVLRPSDYEAFFTDQSAVSSKVAALTTSSMIKIRSTVFTMACDAGLGRRMRNELQLQRPLIPTAVETAIIADSPQWLAGFLVPDEEKTFR